MSTPFPGFPFPVPPSGFRQSCVYNPANASRLAALQLQLEEANTAYGELSELVNRWDALRDKYVQALAVFDAAVENCCEAGIPVDLVFPIPVAGEVFEEAAQLQRREGETPRKEARGYKRKEGRRAVFTATMRRLLTRESLPRVLARLGSSLPANTPGAPSSRRFRSLDVLREFGYDDLKTYPLPEGKTMDQREAAFARCLYAALQTPSARLRRLADSGTPVAVGREGFHPELAGKYTIRKEKGQAGHLYHWREPETPTARREGKVL